MDLMDKGEKESNKNETEDDIKIEQTDLKKNEVDGMNNSLHNSHKKNTNSHCENGTLSDSESTNKNEKDERINCDINEDKSGSVLESMLTQNETNDEEEDDFNPLLLCPDISMDVDESPMVTNEATMENDVLDTNSLFTPLFSTFVDEMTGAEISFNLTPEEQQLREKMYGPDNPIEFSKVHCTACNVHLGSALGGQTNRFVHPLLKVLICKECYHFYTSGEFEKDEDGSELYCRWCGQGGQVLCCSKCEFVFCKKCIRINFGRKKLTMIRDSDEWSCFRCDMSQLKILRAMCVEFFEYVRRETARAAEVKDPDFVNRDRTNCCQTQLKKRLGEATDSDGDKEKTIKRQKRKRYNETDDPDYNPFKERDDDTSRPSSPVPSTSGMANNHNKVNDSYSFGTFDDRRRRKKKVEDDSFKSAEQDGEGKSGAVAPKLPTLLPKPVAASTPFRAGGMSTVRIGDTLVNVKTLPTMPTLRTFPTLQTQQAQQQQQQQQRPVIGRQIGSTVRMPVVRAKPTFAGAVRAAPSASVPSLRTVPAPTPAPNNSRMSASSASTSNTMKHEWFEKTVRAAARVNSNLSYTLTQLNKAQASASSVEQLAVVHNKLQEILSSSINSLIQIRKNLRTEFISGIKTIRFPTQPTIDPNDDDVILVTPPPDVNNKNKAILAGLPQISVKKSTSNKIVNNHNNNNNAAKTSLTPVASCSSTPARGYLKVRSFSQLQTVTSECITIPDDDPVPVEETNADPLMVEEDSVVVEIDLKNDEQKTEDRKDEKEDVEKDNEDNEKEVTKDDHMEVNDQTEAEKEKDNNDNEKEVTKDDQMEINDQTEAEKEKDKENIEKSITIDEEKNDVEQRKKDNKEEEKTELTNECNEKDKDEASQNEKEGIGNVEGVASDNEKEIEEDENESGKNVSEKEKQNDVPVSENELESGKVEENGEKVDGDNSNDSGEKVTSNGIEKESEVKVKEEPEEGSYNVNEKPSPKIRRMLSVKVNLKKSVVVEDFVKKEPLENGE